MSSMQVDDAEPSLYSRDGKLDMRMDRSRGRSAADILATITSEELTRQVASAGDEPQAERIAMALSVVREQAPITDHEAACAASFRRRTKQEGWPAASDAGQVTTHPAARTFQALRILVNRELANLEHLLRLIPQCLAVKGRAAIISFHSGEDRLVKASFAPARSKKSPLIRFGRPGMNATAIRARGRQSCAGRGELREEPIDAGS